MIQGQILNSQATLNNFKVIGAKEFIPGSQFTVFLRLFDTETELRYIPANTATKSIILTNLDGTETTILNANITTLADDRSIMSFIIEESVSTNLAGGNFRFEIDVAGDSSIIEKGVVLNGLSRVIEGAC